MTQDDGSGFSRAERARAGYRAALDALLRDCRPRLVSAVRDLLGERVEREVGVEDVVQETCARACAAIGGFEWRGDDSFLGWLRGIARHVILEAARRQERAACDLEDVPAPEGEISRSRAARRDERFDRLQHAMDRLSPPHRQVIFLSRIEGLPLTEVAERMGRTHDGVRQLLRRALRELKAGFGDTESLGLPPRRLEGGPSDEP